jgi:manganese transport protein
VGGQEGCVKEQDDSEDQRDRGTVSAAREVLSGQSDKRGLARLLPFLGPAFVAAVAYIDPGNYATNIQAGARYGFVLLWVVVGSNLMAMLVQAVSAKLGIATGRNLAEICRDRLPRWLVMVMWVVMEIVAMATDLAEFLGAALGLNLLFNVPLLYAGLATGVATFVILGLEQLGFRPLEAVITGLVGVVSVSYLIETVLERPKWGQVFYHAVIPGLSGPESVLLAAGILGATVMPHAIYLHSSLTQKRIQVDDPEQKRMLFHFEVIDVTAAMTLAGLVNAAMLVMAATTFFAQGKTGVGTIEEAHRTLQPLLGRAASAIFAISLLASGLSSASVGTMAGQMIMQGFLHWHIPIWIRRLVTMAPSLAVIAAHLDPTNILVVSQVVLSFGLPFAVVPLVLFTSRSEVMGVLVNRRLTTAVLTLIIAVILFLNFYLLYQTVLGG